MMKYLSILILSLNLFNCCSQSKPVKQGDFLFSIISNGKTGYIDSSGQVIIEPIFQVAGEFSEGLAFARENGTYGFIDENGKFTIQPQFDYATSFHEGLAVVYKNGKPFFINQKGEKAFNCEFHFIENFKNEKAIVRTLSGKFGVINKKGDLIIDTIFSKLGSFIDGLAVVEGINHYPYPDYKRGIKRNYEAGVIDTNGRFIIPYGKFEKIDDPADGHFKVDIPAEPWDTLEGYTSKTAIIDRSGKIIISTDHKNSSYIDGNLRCGMAKMNLYKYWIPEEKGTLFTTEKSYQGYMNVKGEISINDTTFDTVEDFSDNRAFVKNDIWNYSIINTQGKFVAKNTFDKFLGNGFKNGVAFVAIDWKWGLIDTNANFIIRPQFSGIDDVGMIDGYFFYQQHYSNAENNDNPLTGIAKQDGTIMLKPIIQKFDKRGFINGLLKCVIKDKQAYINKQGQIIWKDNSIRSEQLSNLNIDFMNRGYFYAYSSSEKNEDSGGWALSQNTAKKISNSSNFQKNIFSIYVNTTNKDTFSRSYNGIVVQVVNNTNNKINFNAQDSRLYMKVQALNASGEWKDIEYLPSSWCGNSYHTLSLKPAEYWTFVTPVYEGEFKTKFRIELKYIDPFVGQDKNIDKKILTIYSNEYEGSVNPGQFWRKEDYYPNGIMDPYFD